MRITILRYRKLAIAAAMMMILAACGNSVEVEPPSSQQQTASIGESASGSAASDTAGAEERRIVATTVAITEIMDRLDLELVGIPASVKTLPARYDGVTKVGNPMSPDMELVKSLNPTDVLSVTTLQYDLESVFEQAKISADFLDLTSVASLQSEIHKLGERYGREAEAEAIIDHYESTLENMKRAADGKERPTVLILLGVPGSYLVATEQSYIGDLVRLLGGINIVQGESVEYLASNTEYLHQADPDVILRAAHGMPEEVVKMFDEQFKKNDIWKHFKAVQNGRVYDLEEALFGTTANLYVAEAMEILLPMLYP